MQTLNIKHNVTIDVYLFIQTFVKCVLHSIQYDYGRANHPGRNVAVFDRVRGA